MQINDLGTAEAFGATGDPAEQDICIKRSLLRLYDLDVSRQLGATITHFSRVVSVMGDIQAVKTSNENQSVDSLTHFQAVSTSSPLLNFASGYNAKGASQIAE